MKFIFTSPSLCIKRSLRTNAPSVIFAAWQGKKWVGFDPRMFYKGEPLTTSQSTNSSIEVHSRISWEGSSFPILLRRLELALSGDSVEEAWEAFKDYRTRHGFPPRHFLNKMIDLLSYSSNPQWLNIGYKLVLGILKEKPHLLHSDPLTKMALIFARDEKPVPACTLLRIMLERGEFPSTGIWTALFFHLVKTRVGSYLASDVLVEICELVLDHGNDRKSRRDNGPVLPDLKVFNLLLHSCRSHGSHLKAYKILELMAKVGIVADTNSLMIVSRILDVMGLRDELSRLKKHVDSLYFALPNSHYYDFYDSLLSLHFKHNDFDSAAEIILDLYKNTSISLQPSYRPSSETGFFKIHGHLQIGSNNLRTGGTLVLELKHITDHFIFEPQKLPGFLLCKGGKLLPSQKALAKVVDGYLKQKTADKISSLLIRIHEGIAGSLESTLVLDVIDACIRFGLLEAAHDILDDLEVAGISIGSSSYIFLLRAYYEKNMVGEFKLLITQMRKCDYFAGLSDEGIMSLVLKDDPDVGASNVARNSYFAQLMDVESCENNHLVYEFNASILFFCKAEMMEDSLRILKQMQRRNVMPSADTFSHLVDGYSSLKMYREITILWGDIKRRAESGVLVLNKDLLDSLLSNFLRGGYFERVMEIIKYMASKNIFADKWKYRRDFLKLHKGLYKNLKTSEVRTEAQSKRLDDVRAFRQWAGLDPRRRNY